MDYEHKDSDVVAESSSVVSGVTERVVYIERPVKKSRWRILWRIVIVLLILTVIGALFSDSGTGYTEETLIKGTESNKVVVIKIESVITAQTSREFGKQMQKARADENVKALIIRTNTPGGGVAASDQINHMITKFRQETGKPVVAFMQSIATSGGYYTSVACDTIIAEPTVITGSIGVIMQVMGLQGLFEDKLGIKPVTIKSGEKKDWPNMFTEMTLEQKTYLENKVITPAYDRFVDLVFEGRKEAVINAGRSDVLTFEEVRGLADGSIYGAKEALEKKLIDEIGYFEDVVNKVRSLTKLSSVHVVEYSKPFSLANLMRAETKLGINIDAKLIDEVTTPRLQYLWRPGK
ncbi:MAG: signal peptide peptidase SppA [Planctomycetes bacterium]|nr:signal peptide peptidase SppA [Planctomycetota bacterium]